MSRVLKNIWRRWLRVAEVIGTVQMIVVLSMIYWVLIPALALPFKLLADPLAKKGPGGARWVQRPVTSNIFESMKRQY